MHFVRFLTLALTVACAHSQLAQRTLAQPVTEKVDSQLNRLVQQAQQLEAVRQFAEAAQAWQRVETHLQQRYGSDSWQVTNARLTRETAQHQSQMSSAQLALLEEVALHQKAAIGLTQGTGAKHTKQELAARAIGELQQAVAKTKSVFGDNSHFVAGLKLEIARLEQLRGNAQAAYDAYRECLSISRRSWGRRHPETEKTCYLLGELLRQTHQSELALPFLAEAENLAKQLYGEKSEIYATRINELGVAHHELGKSQEAIALLTLGESIRAELNGTDSLPRAHSLLNLGTVYTVIKDLPPAESSLRACADIFDSQLGREHLLTLQAKDQLAVVLVLSRQTAAAVSLLTESLQVKKGVWSEPNASVAQTQYQLAVLLSRQGNYQQAEPLLNAAIAAQTQLLGIEHAATQRSMAALILLYERTDRPELAERLGRQKRGKQGKPLRRE